MKRRMLTLAAAMMIGSSVFAQAANDGFKVPLDEDLTFAIKENAAPQTAVAAGPNILQGLWLETTANADFLIRDIATGKVSGYEIDQVHFLSNANWWFWGDLGKKLHLDAEISVWNFDMTLFEANSFAGNVPLVTWADGLQGVMEFFFSPLYNGNPDGIGMFNKFGFGISTPWVEGLIGYGNLQANGMSEFQGVFTVLDRWLDVGKGFLELRLGKDLKKIGNVKLDAVAALSQLRGTYGMYDYIDAKIGDNVEAAITFGSMTSAEQLFYYFDESTNAVSAYAAVKPFEGFKAEAHAMVSTGKDIETGFDSMALAARASYSRDLHGDFNSQLMVSYAGSQADSVWGSDGQAYDDINADTITSTLNLDYAPLEFLKVSIDETLTFNDVSALGDGLMTLRSQPMLDLDFNSLLDKDITLGLYGVFGLDRLATETSAGREMVPYFDEAGLEIVMQDVIGIKKLTFDYAAKFNYDDSSKWTGGNSYDWNYAYNSFILEADVNNTFNFHLGAILRTAAVEEETLVPLGIAGGIKLEKMPLPGAPAFWMHACYGMNPYEYNNYSVYRADNDYNKAVHRTYLINTLNGSTTKSQISAGLMWSF